MVGNILHQFLFRFERCLAVVGQADAVGYTEYMRIYCHCRFVVDNGSDDIRCFTSYTGQFLQFVDVGRHHAAEIRDQHLSHSDQVF